jgi:hypothetical protein
MQDEEVKISSGTVRENAFGKIKKNPNDSRAEEIVVRSFE